MSKPSVLTATFRSTTYGTRKGFKFPGKLFTALGCKPRSEVALLVQTLTGETLYCGPSRFISGSEITEAKACRKLGYSQEIIVTASRVPAESKPPVKSGIAR